VVQVAATQHPPARLFMATGCTVRLEPKAFESFTATRVAVFDVCVCAHDGHFPSAHGSVSAKLLGLAHAVVCVPTADQCVRRLQLTAPTSLFIVSRPP
jgi:hypothetical protein